MKCAIVLSKLEETTLMHLFFKRINIQHTLYAVTV